MNVLLLGPNGQLGRGLVEHGGLADIGQLTCASRDGVRFDGASIEVADLALPGALAALLERTNPDVIVNAAAYTAVDRAENEEMLAHTINSDALGQLGNWARRSLLDGLCL
jgi:dTDP-4-dehydrorhamnose reductase